jgi:hypothetical protein
MKEENYLEGGIVINLKVTNLCIYCRDLTRIRRYLRYLRYLCYLRNQVRGLGKRKLIYTECYFRYN